MFGKLKDNEIIGDFSQSGQDISYEIYLGKR